jgi:hypothetical protein
VDSDDEPRASTKPGPSPRRDRPQDLPRAIARGLAFLSMGVAIAIVMRPWLKSWSTFGFHDWDAQTSHRYLTWLSIVKYHQFPGWNPFACGGFPAWGYVEADTNIVSPFLLPYLVLPIQVALRIEVFGMALVSALGAYLAATRMTKSFAARAFVAAVWAVNGRWGLQTAAGHTWHLAYAFLPIAFYALERARDRERTVVDLAIGGSAFAMLIYAGGIYPLPHTILALGLYAATLCVIERSARPITTLAAIGLLGVALSAPKLLPLLDAFDKAPRLVDSTETLDVGALWSLLTSREQAFYSRPARVSPYGWHEWGMYISATGALVLAGGFVFVRGARESALKLAGLVLLLLGFGAFHKEAPWTLLHQLPVFRSQHVPSRFLYPAVLLLALVAAAGIGRAITKRARSMPWLDVLATLAVMALAIDVALVSEKPMADAMWMVPPDQITARAFHFEQEAPLQYKRRDWAQPMYLAMLANTGVMNCYGTPPFDDKGAHPVGDRDYHGEVRVEGGKALATIATVAYWSPNRVDIDVDGAEPGALLIWNMNYDHGWHASGGKVEKHDGAVAVRLEKGTGRVTIAYTPPNMYLGILIAAATIAGLVMLRRRERALEVTA